MSQFLSFGSSDVRAEQVGSFNMEKSEVVFAGFPDQNNNRTLVTNARVRIYQTTDQTTGLPIPIPVKTEIPLFDPVNCPGCYFLLPEGDLRYKFTFFTTGLKPGLYNIQFIGGLDPTVGDITVTGQFIVGYVSVLQGAVDILRDQLYDFNPQLYELIRKQQVWSDTNLLNSLRLAISQINSIPTPTNFDFTSFPYPGLIITLAKTYALGSRAVLEVFNQMQYTDVLSLSIQRPRELQALADSERATIIKWIENWKAWESLYGDTGVGTGVGFAEQKIPFQIARVLSFLPNMKNTFGI